VVSELEVRVGAKDESLEAIRAELSSQVGGLICGVAAAFAQLGPVLLQQLLTHHWLSCASCHIAK
jgi:hypothetical protein